jgi:hypothetical protein
VIFGLAVKQSIDCLKPFNSKETQEVVLIEEPIELGFAIHSEIMKRFFAEEERSSEIF